MERSALFSRLVLAAATLRAAPVPCFPSQSPIESSSLSLDSSFPYAAFERLRMHLSCSSLWPAHHPKDLQRQNAYSAQCHPLQTTATPAPASLAACSLRRGRLRLERDEERYPPPSSNMLSSLLGRTGGDVRLPRPGPAISTAKGPAGLSASELFCWSLLGLSGDAGRTSKWEVSMAPGDNLA
eukprot:scaffold1307_cov200-Pinguiococcus_pyrenoidosus.AAC.81